MGDELLSVNCERLKGVEGENARMGFFIVNLVAMNLRLASSLRRRAPLLRP